MTKKTYKKFPVFATIFMIAGVCVLCALGGWQIERAAWKAALIKDIDEAQKIDELPELYGDELSDDFTFRRYQAIGKADAANIIKIIPRMMDGQMGAHVFVPIKLENGTSILANLGWVPAGWTLPPEFLSGGQADVMGWVRKPDTPNFFTPQNRPEKNEWYFVDMDAIAAAKNIEKLSPYIIIADARAGDESFPRAIGEKPQLNDNHMMYAAFWFTMAGALIVIYFLRFVRRA